MENDQILKFLISQLSLDNIKSSFKQELLKFFSQERFFVQLNLSLHKHFKL